MGTVLRLALCAVATVLLLAPLAAGAQNLGRLALLSRLGEPLDAEIEVTGVPAQARDSLSAQIVPIGVFERFGVTPSPPLEVLQASVVSGGDGNPVVRLRSTVPVQRPAVNVIIELAWSGGRMVRQYAFNVDPPDRAVAKTEAPPPAPQAEPPRAPQVAPAPAAQAAPANPPAASRPAPKPKEKVAAKPAPKEKAAARPRASAAPKGANVEAAESRVKDLERTMRDLQERIDARNREIEALQREVGGTAK
jgi:pilus assembly protein FimV